MTPDFLDDRSHGEDLEALHKEAVRALELLASGQPEEAARALADALYESQKDGPAALRYAHLATQTPPALTPASAARLMGSMANRKLSPEERSERARRARAARDRKMTPEERSASARKARAGRKDIR